MVTNTAYVAKLDIFHAVIDVLERNTIDLKKEKK